MGVAIAAHHVIGGGAQGEKVAVALQRRVLRLHQVDEAEGFGREAVGEEEARESQPCLGRFGGLEACGRGAQAALGGEEAAPVWRAQTGKSRKEGLAARAATAAGRIGDRHARRRQREAALVGDGHARAIDGDRQIVDIGTSARPDAVLSTPNST